MAQVNSSQQGWLVAINQVLPDIEYFLKHDLENEHLSDFSNQKRLDLLKRLESIIAPPDPPPRSTQLKRAITAGQIGATGLTVTPDSPRKYSDGKLLSPGGDHDATAKFIQEQREISRKWGNAERPSDEGPLAGNEELEKKTKHRESRNVSVSSHDHSNLYERIMSGDSYGKDSSQLDLSETEDKKSPLASNVATVNAPPVPDRTNRARLKHPLKDWTSSDKKNEEPVLLHSLKEPIYSGPLKDLRSNVKLWCVLKQKYLYFFRDLIVPAHEKINMTEFDIHIDNVQKTMFRLTKPGLPSFLLGAENDSDFEKWISALERCKYEEIHRTPNAKDAAAIKAVVNEEITNDGEDGYERPQELLEKFEEQRELKLRQQAFQRSISKDTSRPRPEHYVDMSGKGNELEDYETIDDPSSELLHSHSTPRQNRDVYYKTRSLPPTPMNGDRNKDLNTKFDGQSDDNSLSGGFDSLDSDDGEPNKGEETPYQLKPKKYQENKSKEFDFLHDLDAVYCGVLHRRWILNVYQRRYCKLKNDALMCWRNPDDTEKPVLEIPLQDCKIETAAKETRKNTAFKLRRPNGDIFYFSAETQDLMMKWITLIAQIIDKNRTDKIEDSEATPTTEVNKRLSQISTGDTNSIDSREYQMIDEFSGDKELRAQTSESESDADTESDDSSDGEATEPGNRPSRVYEVGTVRSKIMRKLKLKNRMSAESSDEFDDADSDIRGYLYRFYAQRWCKRWCAISHRKFLVYRKASVHHPEDVLSLDSASLSTNVVDERCGDKYNLLLLYLNQNEPLILSSVSSTDWEVWKSLLMNHVPDMTEQKKVSVPPPPWFGRKTFENGSAYRRSLKRSESQVSERKSADVSTLHVIGKMMEVRYKSGKPTEIERWFSLMGREMKICDSRECLDPHVVFDLRTTVVRRMKSEDQGKGTLFSFEYMKDKEEKTMDFKVDEETQMALTPVLWASEAQLIGFETMTLGRRRRYSNNRREGPASAHKDKLVEEESSSSTGTDRTHSAEAILNDSSYRVKSASVPESILQATLPGSKGSTSDLTPRAKNRASALPSERASGGRVSRLFKSLTSDRRNKKHKYRLAKEAEERQHSDVHPKAQFHGNVEEIKTAGDGTKERVLRTCRVSGKIFYAFENGNLLKPIFKVPLRNAAIEDRADHDQGIYTINLSSMEDGTDFTFAVSSEQELDLWLTALTDPSYVSLTQSSKESLLSDDVDGKAKNNDGTSNERSESGGMSHGGTSQSKLLTGNIDGSKSGDERKRSREGEESLERVRLEGFLFVSKSSDMTTTNLRQWVVLKKTFLEIHENKKGRKPRIVLLSEFSSFAVGNPEERREKLKLILRSDHETLTLICNDEGDHHQWAKELKRLTRRRTRLGSDSAKSLLKSTSGNLKQLLSKSDSGKGKRGTLILDDGDQEAVEKYVDFLAPINSLSGPLLQVYENGVTKERFCMIQDKNFLVFKGNKPDKRIEKLDLTKVTLLDETDDATRKYMFRLDNSKDKSLLFECQDRTSAERWMVAVSMAMLLDKLQFGGSRTNLEKSASDYEFLTLANSPKDPRKNEPSVSLQETVGVKSSTPLKRDYKKSSSADDLLNERGSKSSMSSPRENSRHSLSDLTMMGKEKEPRSPTSEACSSDLLEAVGSESCGVEDNAMINQRNETWRTPSSSSGGGTKRRASKDSVVTLEDLLTNKELLESEKYTLQKCLSELKTVVDESRTRRRLSRSLSGSNIKPTVAEEELRTAKSDQQKMKKRLAYVDKELRKVNNEVNRRYNRSYMKQVASSTGTMTGRKWYTDIVPGSSSGERRASGPNVTDEVFVQSTENDNEDFII